jgi:hypothetical protein
MEKSPEYLESTNINKINDKTIVFYFLVSPPVESGSGSVLALSGFSPLPITFTEDRTVVFPTKFSANQH